MAIFSYLSHITQLPRKGQYLLLTDSSSLHSLHELSRWNPLVQRILLILHSFTAVNCEVTLIWTPGHINLPKHDAADLAAKRATSLPRITDNSPLPAADFKSHFHHFILRKWNLLWKQQTNNEFLAIKQVPILPSDGKRLLSLITE